MSRSWHCQRVGNGVFTDFPWLRGIGELVS